MEIIKIFSKKHRKIFKEKISIFIWVGIFSPFMVSAVYLKNPLKISTIEEFLNLVSGFLWVLVIGIAPIMMIWAGILFVTAEGKPERIQKAKDLVKYIVIGIIVAIIAFGLSSIIQEILTPVPPSP